MFDKCAEEAQYGHPTLIEVHSAHNATASNFMKSIIEFRRPINLLATLKNDAALVRNSNIKVYTDSSIPLRLLARS